MAKQANREKRSLAEKAQDVLDGKEIDSLEGLSDPPPKPEKKPETRGGRSINGGVPRGHLPTLEAHRKELNDALAMLEGDGPQTEAQWRKYFDTVARPKGWSRRTYEKIRDTGKRYSTLIKEQEKATKDS